MAEQGSKGRLMPKAKSLYSDGHDITDISAMLGVSKNTLYKWKNESKCPSASQDEWDESRSMREDMFGQVNEILRQQLEWFQTVHPSDRTSSQSTVLAHLISIAGKVEKFKEVKHAAEQVKDSVEKTGGASKETTAAIKNLLGFEL